jgi:hypothetical protein
LTNKKPEITIICFCKIFLNWLPKINHRRMISCQNKLLKKAERLWQTKKQIRAVNHNLNLNLNLSRIQDQAGKNHYDNADTEKITPDVNKQETRESQAAESKKSEPAATLKTVPAKKDDSYERNVNWADVGRKFSNEKKHTSTWIVGLVILIVIAAVAGYILYQNGFFNFAGQLEGDASTSVTQTTQGGLSLDLEETIPENATLQTVEPAAELSNVLYLTVYAAYDKLDPVRIWSDLKPRMDPYWIEQGVALNFEFQDTIRLRGQYDNSILFKNGHRVELQF